MALSFEYKGIGEDLLATFIKKCEKYGIRYEVDKSRHPRMNIKIFYSKKLFLGLN